MNYKLCELLEKKTLYKKCEQNARLIHIVCPCSRAFPMFWNAASAREWISL